MTVTIPVYVIVTSVIVAPFIVARVVRFFDRDGGWFDGALTGFAFLMTAAACWPALLVWAVMR